METNVRKPNGSQNAKALKVAVVMAPADIALLDQQYKLISYITTKLMDIGYSSVNITYSPKVKRPQVVADDVDQAKKDAIREALSKRGCAEGGIMVEKAIGVEYNVTALERR